MPHGESSGHGAGGVAGGMRRRPIDPSRKLPLIRSTKELALDDDTKVEADGVRLSRAICCTPAGLAAGAQVVLILPPLARPNATLSRAELWRANAFAWPGPDRAASGRCAFVFWPPEPLKGLSCGGPPFVIIP